MVTEQRIKTEIPFKYEPVPSVLEIGGKIMRVAGTTYYIICASTTEEYVPHSLVTPTIEDTIEIWGSGYRDLYSPERQFPYGELVRVEEPTYTTIESDFYKLAQQWKQERPRGTDVSEMAMHPSYQRIIGMGPDVVPFLLKELEREPEHWFWALNSITGVNPVPPEGHGKLKEMAKAWVGWGKKQGYRW
jgi:hypothetical protein